MSMESFCIGLFFSLLFWIFDILLSKPTAKFWDEGLEVVDILLGREHV